MLYYLSTNMLDITISLPVLYFKPTARSEIVNC